MAKTIKQIADELGVSKQRVYRYIKANRINEAHQQNGVMYFNEAAEMRIKSGFSEISVSDDVHHEAHHDVHQSDAVDTVCDVLKQQIDLLNSQFQVKDEVIKSLMEQLSAKDKQISEQAEQLKNMTIALNKSQQALQDTTAALTAALNTAQALHAGTIGTMQKQLDTAAESVPEEETISAETAEHKKGFLSRLFNRRK